MMLGTVEKSRVKDFQENIANPKSLKEEKKNNMLFKFLKDKLADDKKDKFDQEEEDLRNNPVKYDIYEERDIITASDGASTARKAFATQNMQSEGGAEERFESNNYKGLNGIETENNSINEDNPDKNTTMKKLMGYYKTKDHPEPDAYDDYCIDEDEFFPSILNE